MPALPPALDTPATPRTPLAAPPRPTRSRPCPVPPPIRAAPWLRSLALFGGGWQDLRTMHDSRARAAKSAPSWQDLRAVYSQTAVCRAFRMHGAHILPKPAHFEYTAAIYCHEEAFFPSEAFFGVHRGKILPSSDTWERITSTYRHRQAPGNAFRGREAMPSAAGNTGCGANCAARAPMNPFTPTFSRCGTDIEFICYATNK